MVESTENKVIYEVGTEKVFPFALSFFEVSDIHCYLKSGDLSRELVSGEFTVEPKDDYRGGANITLEIDAEPGSVLTIVREIPIVQGLSLPENGRLPSEPMENQFDRIIMICQQLKEEFGRSLVLQHGSMIDPEKLFDFLVSSSEQAVRSAGEAEKSAYEAEKSASNAATEVSRLQRITGRDVFEVFYSLSSEVPAGAMDLSLGTVILDCDKVFPEFWSEAVKRKTAGTIPVLTENEWQAALSEHGSCGAFVVDESAKSVRLPKITHILQPGEAGKFTPAGLPNITGDFYRIYTYQDQKTASGAFSLDYYDTGIAPASNQGNGAGVTLELNASRSSSIYGKSDTVQPPVVRAKLYIQVYSSAIPASTAQAAELIRQLSGYLPLAGGEMTGDIYLPPEKGLRTNHTKDVFIIAGEGWRGNGHIVLRGQESEYNPGGVSISVGDGVSNKDLHLWKDGTITWDGKDISLGFPNYAAEVYVGNVNTYTAQQDGWIFAVKRVDASYWMIKINGKRAFASGGSSYDVGTCFLPVKKGDVVKSYNNWEGDPGAVASYMHFYPNR